jgi:hypothetical protein
MHYSLLPKTIKLEKMDFTPVPKSVHKPDQHLKKTPKGPTKA